MEDELIRLIGRRFISRRGVKAVQESSGAWHPVWDDWRRSDFRAHLEGRTTFGHYLVDGSSTKLFAYDIDLDKEYREPWALGEDKRLIEHLRTQLRTVAFGLAYRAHRLLEVPCSVAYSGSKGLHVYGFLGRTDATGAKEAAIMVLGDNWTAIRGRVFFKNDLFPELTIEVFPKQGTVDEDGLGNLMRLPLGRNRKGTEGFFLHPTKSWHADDPVTALTLGSTRFAQEPAAL